MSRNNTQSVDSKMGRCKEKLATAGQEQQHAVPMDKQVSIVTRLCVNIYLYVRV